MKITKQITVVSFITTFIIRCIYILNSRHKPRDPVYTKIFAHKPLSHDYKFGKIIYHRIQINELRNCKVVLDFKSIKRKQYN